MKNRDIILVLRHNGLGDLMIAQPALRALRRTYPDHQLVTTCPSWLEDLGLHLSCVDQLVCDRPHAGTIGPTDHQAADPDVLAQVAGMEGRVDRIVSLRTPGPELLPILAALQPNHLLSYRHAVLNSTQGAPTLDFGDPIFTRWARLLNLWGIQPDPDDLFLRSPRALDRSAPIILHTGAGSPARLWPEDRWADVGRWAKDMGWRILLTGTERERDRIASIARQAGLDDSAIAAGNTSARELLKLVADATCVVSVDSGVAHLATAQRTRAVTLFGPVSPHCWGPPETCGEHLTLWSGREHYPYGDVVDPGLLEITSDEVIGALQHALDHDERA